MIASNESRHFTSSTMYVHTQCTHTKHTYTDLGTLIDALAAMVTKNSTPTTESTPTYVNTYR